MQNDARRAEILSTLAKSQKPISATTLDVDRPFEEIRAQLDTIADRITAPSAPAS